MLKNLLLAVLAATLSCGAFAGEISLQINLDTSQLIGHPAGPFSVNFQLTDGSGVGDANNLATLSDFGFGAGGAPAGIPTLSGGASGDLSSAVMLTDNSFLNLFTQSFTPGIDLSFMLTLTTNVDAGGTPDEFSFSILDNTGTSLPTLAGPFFDVFAAIDIDSTSPTIQTFASDASRSPAGGGPNIDTGSPDVTLTLVPEPATPLPIGLGLALFVAKQFRHGLKGLKGLTWISRRKLS